MKFDEAEVKRTIQLLHGDELFELRYVIGKKIYSGYFKGADKLIEELERLPEQGGNVYITLQDVKGECYNREQHDKILFGKNTTIDKNIETYSHLLIDLDPRRSSGIGSTNAQLEAAHNVAVKVYEYLQSVGFKPPIAAISGNGWHLIYRIALDNTEENEAIICDCLKVVDMLFSDDIISIDTTVSNPSRVSKLYGTWACKGADTEETPYRLSCIKAKPEEYEITPKEILQKLAENAPKKDRPRVAYTGDVYKMPPLADWLTQHNVPVRETVTAGGVTKYILQCCPFNADHKNKDAAVFELADGSYGFKCFHNSCSDKHWREFREFYEPDAYTRGEPDTGLKPNHASVTYSAKGAADSFLDNPPPPTSAPIFYTLSDILAFPEIHEEYIPTGITELDKSLGGLKKGLVTCVSGLRGSGKSSLLSQVLLHGTLIGGARAAMFSGELTSRTAADWLFRQAAGSAVEKISKFDTKYYVPANVKAYIAEKVADKIFIYNNDYGNKYETVIGEMCRVVETQKVDLILLDNLMSLDINSLDSKDKYRSQSLFVERLENFAKKANIHIIFVAHPRKAQGFLRLDDISGSGDIANRVDNALIIHRKNEDFRRKTQEMFRWKDDNALYAAGIGNVVEICKDRENGTQDKFIPLYFEHSTKRLKNRADENIDYLDGKFAKIV